MAFPTYISKTSAILTSNGTSLDITYPASIAAGDDLICFIAIDQDNAAGSTMPGFTRLQEQHSGGGSNAVYGAVFHKIAAGTESGSVTITFGSSSSDMASAVMFRISGSDGETAPPSSNIGFSEGTLNPAAPGTILASGGEFLVFDLVCVDGPNNYYSADPSGFTNRHNSGADSSTVFLTVATDEITGDGSTTYGDEAHTISVARLSCAFSVAIKGSGATPITELGTIAQQKRTAGAGDYTAGALTEPGTIAQQKRTAGAGDATLGPITELGSQAQAKRGAADGEPIIGDLSEPGTIAQAKRGAGDGEPVVGDLSEVASQAQAKRGAFPGDVIAGAVTRPGVFARVARRAFDGLPALVPDQVVGSVIAQMIRRADPSSAIRGAVSESSAIARAGRRGLEALAIPGAVARLADGAAIERLVPGFSSSITGIIAQAVIAQIVRLADEAGDIMGGASRVGDIARAARRVANASAPIRGERIEAGTIAQIIRLADTASPIVGDITTPANIAQLIRAAAAADLIAGPTSRTATAADILRRALDAEVIAGVFEVSTMAAIARAVPGASAPVLGGIAENAEIARIVRASAAGDRALGDVTRAAIIAEITRQVSGFSLYETALAVGSIMARLERIVPGASGAILGAVVVESTDPATLSRLAGIADAITGGITTEAEIAELIRRSIGGARGILGTLIEPAEAFTLTLAERGALMAAPARGADITIHERGAIMAISAKKVQDFTFEREQTTGSKIPWSMDWASRLAEYGINTIIGGTVTAEPATGLTLGAVQVSGLLTSFECQADTAGEYELSLSITFGGSPFIDIAHIRLRVRDVPRI